jgi:A/G-specific adenine glycosylase
METHAGRMPTTLEALHALPGIGRYTAGAVASFAYDAIVPAVDANIARVLTRLFDVRDPLTAEPGKSAVWEAAERLLPKTGGRLHNSALMELGALLCTARAPRCGECPVHRFCAAERPAELPIKAARRATVALVENCGWVRQAKQVLLEQQDGPRWRGLWKLPLRATPPAPGEALWEGVYPFTHHRVTLRVFASDPPAILTAHQRWFGLDQLEAVALAAAHRRAAESLVARDP